jgi:4-hydroxythreonine-4-phosphate dehydrogenase
MRITPHSHAPIAITMGDPAGIGPEIIAKLFDDALRNDPALIKNVVVLGDRSVMERAIKTVGFDLPVVVKTKEDLVLQPSTQALPLLQCGTLDAPPRFGQISAAAGKAAYDAIITGIDLAMAGRMSALVTAPIHKEALHAAGIKEPGHTEILASRSGTEEFGMMLANDDLRVMLVSIHLSLRDAIAAVTIESVLRAIRLADQATRRFGINKPRLAVAGLNPHAGEGGLFGQEEITIIRPAISIAQDAGFDVTGPFAPDTVFMRARQGEFDAVIAMYHDQGLIPVKYLGVDHGVNITAGLPFIRTSVDHGTAFDLAGTGKARHDSLVYALKTARRMLAGVPA